MWLNRTKRSLGIGALSVIGISAVAIAFWTPDIKIETLKGNRNTVSVRFQGTKAAALELEVNGIAVAYRTLTNQSAGQAMFQLDTSQLAPGFHDVKVNLYDHAGRLVGSNTRRIEILPDGKSPVTVLIPRNGTRVAGAVQIEVQVRTDSSQKPFVSFFVDREFRTLRNFSPYTYTWDTTQETNGWHEIEAWSFDGSQTVKSPTVRVYVNNPGGRTERAVEKTEPGNPVTAQEAVSSTSTGAQTRSNSDNARMMDDTRLNNPAEAVDPASTSQAQRMAMSPAPGTLRNSNTPAPRPVSDSRLQEPSRSNDEPARLSNAPVKPAHPESQVRSGELNSAMTGQKLHRPQTAMNPAPVKPVKPAKLAAGKPWVPVRLGTRLPAHVQEFNVLYDATILTFDVQPRTLNGVPIAPLRHIHEHAGGRLKWDQVNHTVTALNGSQTVILQIGNPVAKIDGQSVKMEIVPGIISGRTMVPLSFVRDMLGVDVYFDPNVEGIVIQTKD